MPRVSVILPTYNGMSQGLAASVDSILGQEFRDLELLVVVDGSSDSTLDWLARRQRRDSRLRSIIHARNEGLLSSLIEGVSHSSSPWVARQDDDDFSRPKRLAYQMSFLEAHRSVGLLGTAAKVHPEPSSDVSRASVRRLQHPAGDMSIRWRLLWSNPFVHSSVIFSRALYESAGGYAMGPTGDVPEDLSLWARMALRGQTANLPRTLVDYREGVNGVSYRRAHDIRTGTVAICQSYALEVLEKSGLDFCPEAVRDLVSLLVPGGTSRPRSSPRELRQVLPQFRAALQAYWGASQLEHLRTRVLLEMRLRTVGADTS